MQICFLRVALALTTLAGLVTPAHAGFVTFGTSGNQFTMEFVAIGNPGNTADNTGAPNPAGSVGYTYDIGKFEVSRDMINKYNASFGNANARVITMADMTSYGGNGINKPATDITWNEAARFVNWLNTSSGYYAAYKFTTTGVNDDIALWNNGDLGYDASNPYRNRFAKYVLPSYNEWYKAAYYTPATSSYFDYPTGSNSAPTSVASGNTSGTAVYGTQAAPADVTIAGGLSPYGVMGLGGNVFEWEESSSDLTNSSGTLNRGNRGGNWSNDIGFLHSTARIAYSPTFTSIGIGFRVASVPTTAAPVPEPSMMMMAGLLGLGGYISNRRMKKYPV